MFTESKEKIPDELQKLANNRALILLVELMGFLHDVGKLSKDRSNHHKRYEEDVKIGIVPNDIKEIFGEGFENFLKNSVSKDILEKIKNCKIESFQRHHTGKRYKSYWPTNWIEEIINLADDKDSSEDRKKPLGKQDEFLASVFGMENRFQKEMLDEKRKEFYNRLQKDVKKLHRLKKSSLSLEDWKHFHVEIINYITEYFSYALAETRRAANDVTLFDHSFMTGSIAKSLVSKAILDSTIQERFSQQIIRRNAIEVLENKDSPKEEKEIAGKTLEKIQPLDHFDDECDLDLLLIRFNALDFLSQSQNLLDIRGRKELINEIKDEIKNLLEIDFPIGNCVYEDDESLCFLITPLNEDSFGYLKGEITRIFNENTEGLLLPIIERERNCKFFGRKLVELKNKYDKKKFQITEIPKWIEKWGKEVKRDVCILCGKMPQWNGREKDYLCKFCWELRYKTKPKMKEEKKIDDETIWIDEIADENGKIALIIGKFAPLDKWLSGEFLKYQKIRTLEDVKIASKKEELPSIEEAIENLIEEYPKWIKEWGREGKDFTGLLRNNIGKLSKNANWSYVIGGKSLMGEIRERIREIDEHLVKKWEENNLNEKEKNDLKKALITIIETKPPSPSRLYRIWGELEEFSELKEVVKEIPTGIRLTFENEELKKELKNNLGFYVVKNQEIGEISTYWDGEKLFTVERIDKKNPMDKFDKKDNILITHKEISDKLDKKKTRILLFDEKSREKLGEFNVTIRKDKNYERYRKITVSPTGFMLITPANKAFELTREISKQFYQNFSKALGKLSLNIGVVFTHRKTPIFALLEAGKRFLNEFSSLEKPVPVLANRKNNKLTFIIDGKEINWEIDTKLGDGNIDYYYPYFISSDGKPLHFLEINENKKITVYLNRFDFEYLDSSIRRFDIFLENSEKRYHPVLGRKGPRPYLLEELEKFVTLEEIFRKIGKWTPIRDVASLTQTKLKEWEINEDSSKEKIEVYRKFVETTVQNKFSRFFDKTDFKNNRKPFIVKCILDGSFFDAIELFHSIMKIDLGGEKVE